MKKMTSGRKKILFQTDFSLAKTGFGRSAKAILTYLYNLNKYEIVHLCCGKHKDSEDLQKTPWKSIGTIPTNPAELEQIGKEERGSEKAFYGFYNLDEVMREEKPDIYIGIQDIWGISYVAEKPWFEKITSVIWTTLDSLPIFPLAVDVSKKSKNFWVWSDFATKALREMGHENVKTVHGPIEDSFFYNLSDDKKNQLRLDNLIDPEDFIIGFVFRNQPRKSVPNLLKGFSKWKQESQTNSKLLLHTSFSESWDIPRLAAEENIAREDILVTYVCKNCKNYSVINFSKDGIPCLHCGSKDSCSTPTPRNGVTEAQLNEIYNLMDVYCHPFTSGGQEVPIQEAKLTELITLVTNYSCGEEMCEEGAASIPLDWTEYREHDTEFIKASTSPDSITESLKKVYSMSKKDRDDMGKKAREWTLENYRCEKICEFLEKFIDKSPKTKYKFLNPHKKINPKLSDLLDDDEGKRVLFVMPEKDRDVFLSTSLFRSVKELYSNYNLYVATKKEYFPILEGNKHIHKVIEYSAQMDNLLWLEGKGEHKGFFNIAFIPYTNTQKIITFTHNGEDKIAYKDLTYECIS